MARRQPTTGTLLLAVSLCAPLSACNGRMVLTDQLEARRLGASVHVQFVKANEAANRAVMLETDEASVAAAAEARSARDAAERDLDQLEPLVQRLGYQDEIALVRQFRQPFAEYRKLDEEVLVLAVENTNLKAQRLAAGTAQQSADALFAVLDDAVAATHGSTQDEALKLRIENGVLHMQILQARHIVEADDTAMTQMEGQMAASERQVRQALGTWQAGAAQSPEPRAAASDALERFVQANREIVDLSRRNTTIRSLAVTLGRKRLAAAECESQLAALGATLATHTFQATR